jgi:hypothetical protein
MRNISAALLVLSLCAVNSISQTATNDEAAAAAGATGSVAEASAPEAAAPTPVITDANAIRVEVETTLKLRAKEEAELKAQREEAQQDLLEQQAKEKQYQSQLPKIDEAIDEYKKKADAALQAQADLEPLYRAAEATVKESFVRKVIGELQAKYDEEFRRALAVYTDGTNFVARNRINLAEFDKLQVALDPSDATRMIRFDGLHKNEVSGCFPTMNFALGQTVWHQIPNNATFQATVQKRNPFVADVLIKFGADILRCGSTNMLDWDIHMFIGKDFTKKDGEKDKFMILGVSWPVDLGRPMCWQCGIPPVFEVIPKPVRAVAGEATPEIAKQISEWVFSDPLWLTRKKEAIAQNRGKHRDLEHAVAVKNTQTERIGRNIAESKEKQKEIQQKIEDINNKLIEYQEDAVEAPATPAVVPGTNSPAPSQEGL